VELVPEKGFMSGVSVLSKKDYTDSEVMQ